VSKKSLSDWQRRVLADLAAIAEAFPEDVAIQGGYRLDSKGSMKFRLRLRTADIAQVDGGLPLREHEEFTVTVGPSDLVPPNSDVDHLRFLHHAHVLQGQRLCLYLDASREWDPINGFGGFIDRLIEWLADAAAGRFDAQTALYHAVGGVLHANNGAPTVVIRESLRPRIRAQHGWLVTRSPHRFDLTLKRPACMADATHVPVLMLDADLPFGAGNDLRSLMVTVDNPYFGHPAPGRAMQARLIDTGLSKTLLTVLGASAIRKPDGTPQHIVIAVPHPTGGPPHLLAATIPASGADHIRALVRASRKRSSMIDIDNARVDLDTPLEWWPVSDERGEVTTRRDSARPVAAFSGKTIHVWGCGGLGSWVAEYVVRAGAKKIALCDPASITGGLLVRQNFVEADVGNTKVEALAQRMRAISDTVEVSVHDSPIPAEPDFVEVDVIIDATVSIAIGRLLDGAAGAAERPVLAQMATDARTGTLGIMTVSMPPLTAGPLTIDRHAGRSISANGKLEAFHGLWKSPESSDEIIPTRGCSTPTFHGSAADLAGVAGSLTSILGGHLGASTAVSGTHLISLPHGEAGPLRTFVPVEEDDASEDQNEGAA
jgi:ThiF family/Prokaryotic E2 family A